MDEGLKLTPFRADPNAEVSFTSHFTRPVGTVVAVFIDMDVTVQLSSEDTDTSSSGVHSGQVKASVSCGNADRNQMLYYVSSASN